MGIVGTHPGSFCKSGKQRAYRIRNLEEYTEDGRYGDGVAGGEWIGKRNHKGGRSGKEGQGPSRGVKERFGADVFENSQTILPWITELVKYFNST